MVGWAGLAGTAAKALVSFVAGKVVEGLFKEESGAVDFRKIIREEVQALLPYIRELLNDVLDEKRLDELVRELSACDDLLETYRTSGTKLETNLDLVIQQMTLTMHGLEGLRPGAFVPYTVVLSLRVAAHAMKHHYHKNDQKAVIKRVLERGLSVSEKWMAGIADAARFNVQSLVHHNCRDQQAGPRRVCEIYWIADNIVSGPGGVANSLWAGDTDSEIWHAVRYGPYAELEAQHYKREAHTKERILDPGAEQRECWKEALAELEKLPSIPH